MGIEGLYTAITAVINEREDTHRVMDVKELIKMVKAEVNVYSAPVDWFINQALMAAIESSLGKMGYRSVVHGEGLFVNLDKCKNKHYLARMLNEAKLAEIQKEQALNMITKQIKNSGVEGQMSIDFSTLTCVEDLTDEQLIEMLRADAGEGPTITEEANKNDAVHDATTEAI